MGVFSTLVDLQLAEQLTTEGVVGEHSLHSLLDDPLGDPCLQGSEGFGLHATGATGVAAVELVGSLVTAHLHLLSVDHHDEVAGVDVRGEVGVVLTPQNRSDLGGKPAEGLVLSVHQIPLAG